MRKLGESKDYPGYTMCKNDDGTIDMDLPDGQTKRYDKSQRSYSIVPTPPRPTDSYAKRVTRWLKQQFQPRTEESSK